MRGTSLRWRKGCTVGGSRRKVEMSYCTSPWESSRVNGHSLGEGRDQEEAAAPTLPEPPIACTSIFCEGSAKTVEHDASEHQEPFNSAYRVSRIENR